MPISLGIVDDDKDILYTVKAMVDSIGIPIRCTTNPHEAISWAADDLIDVLLVDYHMPGMSGLDVISRIRQTSSTVLLLALTVEEDPEVAKQLLLAGADDFVSKPIRLADFSARIALHAELVKYRRSPGWADSNAKALPEATVRRIYSVVEAQKDWVEITEVCRLSNMAYPTVHRYLEHLVAKGQLIKTTASKEDGGSGRPRQKYKIAFKDRFE